MSRRTPAGPNASVVSNNLHVQSALVQLREAHDLGVAAGRPKLEFVLPLTGLLPGGSSLPAMIWLVYGKYAQHYIESMRSGRRVLRPAKNHVICAASCFLLTKSGLKLAQGVEPNDSRRERPARPAVPHWDRTNRELWVGDRLVLRLTRRAKNQILILEAFEEEGWPAHIFDPLPGDPTKKRKRLRNAIERLNASQLANLLRFHANGSGDGIRWELV